MAVENIVLSAMGVAAYCGLMDAFTKRELVPIRALSRKSTDLNKMKSLGQNQGKHCQYEKVRGFSFGLEIAKSIMQFCQCNALISQAGTSRPVLFMDDTIAIHSGADIVKVVKECNVP